jgi:hypothetical protein
MQSDLRQNLFDGLCVHMQATSVRCATQGGEARKELRGAFYVARVDPRLASAFPPHPAPLSHTVSDRVFVAAQGNASSLSESGLARPLEVTDMPRRATNRHRCSLRRDMTTH